MTRFFKALVDKNIHVAKIFGDFFGWFQKTAVVTFWGENAKKYGGYFLGNFCKIIQMLFIPTSGHTGPRAKNYLFRVFVFELMRE